MTLQVSGLTYRFADTGRGCANVSFTARSGQLTALTAPSGAGKSTALAATAGVLTPQAGDVLLDDRPLAPGDAALVLQTAQVFDRLTAWENVACSWGIPTARLRGRAVAELARYGLEEVADSRPNQLSGGQRQRVALVAALAQNKQLLLADEVTSHLDEANAKLVIATLREAAKNRVVVVASHDARLSAAADHVVNLREETHSG